MTMKLGYTGFCSENLQYMPRAGHSAKESPGVACARRHYLTTTQFSVFCLHTRYMLGGSYGGARVWQESCAWVRENCWKSVSFRISVFFPEKSGIFQLHVQKIYITIFQIIVKIKYKREIRCRLSLLGRFFTKSIHNIH